MKFSFYQIAGDQPGTVIYINPTHVVKVVPHGQNSRIYLTDKTVYDVAQAPNIVSNNLLRCLGAED